MTQANKDRLKSPFLWTGLASIFILLMGNYGLWDYIGMQEGIFRELVNLVLGLFGSIGVINNPTDPINW
jgi:uncharacterized membrane protein